jgi:hypothetical protein
MIPRFLLLRARIPSSFPFGLLSDSVITILLDVNIAS